MKSVADLARKAGFDVDSMGQIYPMDDESCSDNIERLLALHKAEVIKELCADEEPVAWRTFDGEGGYDFRGYEWNEDYQSRWDANNPKHIGWVDALYPASTVAALQARVAELESLVRLCGACNGTGWVTRDPDIGTDQECWVCDGAGKITD